MTLLRLMDAVSSAQMSVDGERLAILRLEMVSVLPGVTNIWPEGWSVRVVLLPEIVEVPANVQVRERSWDWERLSVVWLPKVIEELTSRVTADSE